MKPRQCRQGLPYPFCSTSSTVGLTRQRGVGLIEVLVALVLLSTSLLGMGMLQVKTLQYQRASYSETMAQLLALNMAERIQSNLSALAAYDGKSTKTYGKNSCTDDCNAKQVMEHDLSAWKDAIEQTANTGLTEGEGRIAIDTSTTPARVTLTILWKDTLKNISSKDDKNTSMAEFTFEVQP